MYCILIQICTCSMYTWIIFTWLCRWCVVRWRWCWFTDCCCGHWGCCYSCRLWTSSCIQTTKYLLTNRMLLYIVKTTVNNGYKMPGLPYKFTYSEETHEIPHMANTVGSMQKKTFYLKQTNIRCLLNIDIILSTEHVSHIGLHPLCCATVAVYDYYERVCDVDGFYSTSAYKHLCRALY